MSESPATTPEAVPESTQSRARSTAMWSLLVLAGVLLFLSSFAVWIDRVALNTTAFTNTSSDLLQDGAIRNVVATTAVDELYSSVDVEAEIKKQLPDNLQSVAGIAAAGIRQGAYQVVDRALEQPALQKAFEVAVEQAHETLVNVLEGGGPNASTQGGVVTLDLRSIVVETADRIGIGSQVVDKIPADAGRVVVLRSDQLHTAQSVFRILKTLAWFLPLLTIAAFGAAVGVARDRRRAIRGFGLVAIAVGVLGLVAARVTGFYIVGSLVKEKETRTAAGDAWGILTTEMRTSFRWMVALGLLVVVGAYLTGPGRRAIAARGWLAPALANRAWGYVGLAILAVVLLALSPTLGFARLLWIVVVVVLGAFWIETMRSRSLREHPEATMPAFVGEARARVSTWWTEGRASVGSLRARAAAPSPPEAAGSGLEARLRGLAELHASGELTDEEYSAAKARVLTGD